MGESEYDLHYGQMCSVADQRTESRQRACDAYARRLQILQQDSSRQSHVQQVSKTKRVFSLL